jgi:hypothetical protein
VGIAGMMKMKTIKKAAWTAAVMMIALWNRAGNLISNQAGRGFSKSLAEFDGRAHGDFPLSAFVLANDGLTDTGLFREFLLGHVMLESGSGKNPMFIFMPPFGFKDIDAFVVVIRRGNVKDFNGKTRPEQFQYFAGTATGKTDFSMGRSHDCQHNTPLWLWFDRPLSSRRRNDNLNDNDIPVCSILNSSAMKFELDLVPGGSSINSRIDLEHQPAISLSSFVLFSLSGFSTCDNSNCSLLQIIT